MKKCKRLFAGILSLTVLISCFAGCNGETQTIDLKNIQLTDAQIQEVSDNTDTELTEGNFSGTAYAGLNRQDIFMKSYGYTDEKKNEKLDNDYVYQLGSVSKIFTGLAVMKLNSDGKLELSDTLDKFFPEYNKKEYKEITIANLLDMTAGFGSYTSYLSEDQSFAQQIGKMVNKNPDNPKISHKVLDYILTKGPENEVGEYCYSHSCYYILGKVIEKITNKSAFDYIKESVIKPLGLKNTSMINTKGNKNGYNESNKEWRNQEDFPILNNPYVMYVTMGIQSSAEDLAKVCDGILYNKIVDDCLDTIENSSSHYNYGFYINGDTIYSEGATVLHSGYVYINTEYFEKVVLLSNHTGISDFEVTAKNVYNKLNSKINGIIINQIEN